ncbi:MAG: exo-alpha-sialidase [Anaerolineae bacterium]|nr:exo-alpha-sialidase [Anaerolineae bacterium]
MAQTLLDQESSRVIIQPNQRESGYWFGGGNLVVAPDGTWYLSGRYRNYGDSRTGLEAGSRGVELAVFRSHDQGQSFAKILSFTKRDLSLPGQPVLSIEGSALHFVPGGVELYVSTEKANVPYPEYLRAFHKDGTGVWSLDRLQARDIAGLAQVEITPFLNSRDPRFLHVKDPVIYDATNRDTLLSFCTHPYNWASSNSGCMLRGCGEERFSAPNHTFFHRGYTWDVAISRITSWMAVPQYGVFAKERPLILAFYDGGESMRNLDQHEKALHRPRGYSCEEIGGLAWGYEGTPQSLQRLSVELPMFLSPWGSGSSRYVDVVQTRDGIVATWEQSRPDFSQPLVMHRMSWDQVHQVLS